MDRVRMDLTSQYFSPYWFTQQPTRAEYEQPEPIKTSDL